MSFELTVIIPGRREEFFRCTVEDVLAHTTASTSVIAVLDEAWADPPLDAHPRLTVVHEPVSIGQRAATNLGARLAESRWIAKLDAHCSIPTGWDVSLMETSREMGRDVTIIPQMYNLHAFDWVCGACGAREYQGPQPTTCQSCKGAGPFEKAMVWKKRGHRLTQHWRLDARLEFQYWGAFGSRPEAQGDVVDSMTSIGACFFMERERFWQLGGLDEAHGSWGFFGAEVALKSWLSGGKQVVSRRTWFAHMFRTRKDFSFPYPISGQDQQRAKDYGRDLWLANAWDGQVRPLRWLVDRFWPVAGWSEADRDALPAQMTGDTHGVGDVDSAAAGADGGAVRDGDAGSGEEVSAHARALSGSRRGPAGAAGLVRYSHGRGDPRVLDACRRQLAVAAEGRPLVNVTLSPEDFGTNLVLTETPGPLAMFKQILAGLEALDTEYAFLVEHDVLYAPQHFAFIPPRADTYYYNLHWWKLDATTGRAITYEAKQTSQLCANRELLVAHYRARVERVEREGFSLRTGYEPGSHRRAERIDDVSADVWRSAVPNIDIRHSGNLTPSRWSPQEFRDQRNCRGWQEAPDVPGWGETHDVAAFLARVGAREVVTC